MSTNQPRPKKLKVEKGEECSNFWKEDWVGKQMQIDEQIANWENERGNLQQIVCKHECPPTIWGSRALVRALEERVVGS